MKALLLLALVPFTASAATELRCSDQHAGPDHGYSAVVKRLTTAQVTMQSIAGPQPVASMKCSLPHSVNRPDRPHLVAICTDYSRPGQGYMLTVHAGAGGTTSATLEMETASGRRAIAQLDCRAR